MSAGACGGSSGGERKPFNWRFWEKKEAVPAPPATPGVQSFGYSTPPAVAEKSAGKSDQDFAYRMNHSHSQAERAKYQQKMAERARRDAERSVKQVQRQQKQLEKDRQRNGSDSARP
jgi:hypothetical protein